MMFGFSITEFVQSLSLLSIPVGIIGAYIAYQRYKDNLNANLLIHYSERYERILDEFPNEALKLRFDLESDPPPESDQLSLCILKYLNMCSEEFYLMEQGYIDKQAWDIWNDEIQRTLRSKLLRREWNKLKSEFESYPKFKKYVEDIQQS